MIPERDLGKVIYDLAEVLDPASGEDIEAITWPLARAHRPIIVLTIKRLADYHADVARIASFGTAVYNTWGIGSPAHGNVGALILLAKEDRKVFVAVGEGVKKDRIDRLQSIIADVMMPKFKAGDYAGGLLDGVRAIRDRVINPVAAQAQPESTASRPTEVIPAGTWDAGAIKDDPVGFVTYAIPRLRAGITAAESAQNGLREASEKFHRLGKENLEKSASTEAALNAFREMFQSPNRTWPLRIAGREYDEATFMKEIDRLLDESRLLVAAENEIAVAATEADRNAQHLGIQLGIYRATLSLFEELKPLVKKPLSSTYERTLVSARERLADIEEPWDPSDIRVFLERLQPASRKSRRTAVEFLSQKPETRK